MFRQYKASEKRSENISTKPTPKLSTGLRTPVLIKKVFNVKALLDTPFPIQLFTVQAKTVVFCHTLIS